MSDDKPKLIIDEDWKSEANREKERLAEKEAQAEQAKAEANRPLEFSDVVRLMASQAAMYLGIMPEPQSGQRILAPELARTHIDILAVLEAKTKGNLTAEEDQELSETLRELRAIFVETAKSIEKAVAEGLINPDGSPGPNAPKGPAGGPAGPMA
ncbi:MAG: DUF1844 domain-containing protein [Phycisphaerales bacterium]|nr:DUF1844 domain-containing protein [Phycisphaerales bacterium]MCB9836591.1 DUF1844 domain-containing protein [Phycisphaera sp.]